MSFEIRDLKQRQSRSSQASILILAAALARRISSSPKAETVSNGFILIWCIETPG